MSKDKKSNKGKAAVSHENLPYRPCVGIALFNDQGKVLVARRNDVTFVSWQMPQGGIDKNEPPKKAARRELLEEIGTSKADIIGETPGWLSYDFPEALIGKVLRGRYRGQKQKWFAMRFTGLDGDIDLNRYGDAEFDAWKWVEIEELTRLIVDFKLPVYQAVVEAFRHLAQPLDRRNTA